MRATFTLRQKVPHVRHHVQPFTARPRRLPQFASVWRPVTLQRAEGSETEQVAPEPTTRDGWKVGQEALQSAPGHTVDSADDRERTIKQLNEYLALAASLRTESQHKLARKRREDRKKLWARLWKAYRLAKSVDATILSVLSEQDWRLLWTGATIQAQRDQFVRTHVDELYRTMVSAGLTPTSEQKIAYLKSIFMRGREKETLEKWEELSGPDGCRSDAALFECGIWLHAYAGDLVRAKEMLDTLFEMHPDWDQGITMAVFRAHCRSAQKQQHDVAWNLYTRMKASWSEGAAPQEYDSCFIGFLEARCYDYGEQVFVDSVRAGHLAADASEKEVARVLRGLFHLYELTKDSKAMTRLCTLAIAVLPKEFSPHVFEHWLRWAGALEHPNAALDVLDAMFKRGCEPSVLHFNLVLAALFREGDKSHELKAENIGWQMIESLTEHGTASIPSTSEGQDGALQRVPPANTATFAHLMSHHVKHGQWEHVDYLIRKFREHSLHPNELIMNVLMGSEGRKGNYTKTWQIYTSLVHNPKKGNPVFPNGASFRCLWKTLRLALENSSPEEREALPTPRALLAEMIQWFTLVQSRYDADAFRKGLAGRDGLALSKLVLHSFGHAKDLPGSLVALHVLWHHFDLPPPVEAVEILKNQIAWIDVKADAQHPSALQEAHTRVTGRMRRLGQVFQTVVEQRGTRLGIEPGDLGEKEMCEFMLMCLSECVRVVLVRQYEPGEVEDMIEDAKGDVGLPDLPTGDVSAFDVT